MVDTDPLRHEYRQLSLPEKQTVVDFKNYCQLLLNVLHKIDGTRPNEAFRSREITAAADKVDEACMWAVKYVTRKHELMMANASGLPVNEIVPQPGPFHRAKGEK